MILLLSFDNSGRSRAVVQLWRASSTEWEVNSMCRASHVRWCHLLVFVRNIEKGLVNISGKAVTASVYTWTTSNVRNKVPNMAEHTTGLCLKSRDLKEYSWVNCSSKLLRVESKREALRAEHGWFKVETTAVHCGKALTYETSLWAQPSWGSRVQALHRHRLGCLGPATLGGCLGEGNIRRRHQRSINGGPQAISNPSSDAILSDLGRRWSPGWACWLILEPSWLTFYEHSRSMVRPVLYHFDTAYRE